MPVQSLRSGGFLLGSVRKLIPLRLAACWQCSDGPASINSGVSSSKNDFVEDGRTSAKSSRLAFGHFKTRYLSWEARAIHPTPRRPSARVEPIPNGKLLLIHLGRAPLDGEVS